MRALLLTAIALVALALVFAGTLLLRDPSATDAAPLSGGPAGPAPVQPAGSTSPADLAELDPAGPEQASERSRAGGTEAAPAAGAERSAGRLVGRVTDERGQPVVGAEVELRSGAFLFDEDRGGIRPDRDTTDAEGRFALEVSGAGRWSLGIGADGFAPFSRSLELSGEGEHDAGELALAPGVVLAGTVRDRAGRPVADAVFLARATSDGDLFVLATPDREVARSDASGRFELRRVAVGEYRLVVRHEDHPDALVSGSVERAGQRVADLEVVLEDGARITGFVEGAPEGEALEVTSSPVRPGTFEIGELMLSGRRSARVAADGSFELRGLEPETEVRLTARSPGAGRGWLPGGWSSAARSESVRARAGESGVRIVYSAGSTLTLRVADARSGKPLTDFRVEAGIHWPAPLQDEGGEPRTHFPDGLVEIPGLRPTPADDTLSLRIEATGYRVHERDDLRLVVDQDLDLGVVRLEPVPLVRVTVLDADGEPVQGADVTLAQHREQAAGGFSVRREVRIGAGGAGDSLEIGDGERRTATTDATGACALSSFPGEQVVLEVRAEGFAPHESEPFLLPTQGDHREEVRLVSGGSVLVRVLDPDGVPVAGRRVEHREPGDGGEPVRMVFGGGGGQGRRTNERGEVRFEALAPGVHRFRLGSRSSGGGSFVVSTTVLGGAAAEEPGWSSVEVLDRQESELVLAAPASSSLEGRVLEAGVPLAGATLRLEEEQAGGGAMALALPGLGGGGQTARTDGKGTFRFDEVDAGKYTLTITHSSRAMPDRREVRVDERGSELELDLPVTVVEGRVLDPAGEPLVGIRVQAERSDGGGGPRTRMMMVLDSGGDGPTIMTGGDGEPATATTDEEGRYRLRGVQPDVDLVVTARGGEFQPTRSEVLRVPAGALEEGVDIVMQEAGRLRVTVRAADGSPASMALVNARHEGESETPVEPRFEVAREGLAEFSGLRPGVWSVRATPMGEAQGGEATTVEVVAGETVELTLDLP